MTTALTCCWDKLSKALSISLSLWALRITSSTPSARAAACVSVVWKTHELRARDQLTQQLQQLRPECGDQKSHSRDIAAGPVGFSRWPRRQLSPDRPHGRACMTLAASLLGDLVKQ